MHLTNLFVMCMTHRGPDFTFKSERVRAIHLHCTPPNAATIFIKEVKGAKNTMPFCRRVCQRGPSRLQAHFTACAMMTETCQTLGTPGHSYVKHGMSIA